MCMLDTWLGWQGIFPWGKLMRKFIPRKKWSCSCWLNYMRIESWFNRTEEQAWGVMLCVEMVLPGLLQGEAMWHIVLIKESVQGKALMVEIETQCWKYILEDCWISRKVDPHKSDFSWSFKSQIMYKIDAHGFVCAWKGMQGIPKGIISNLYDGGHGCLAIIWMLMQVAGGKPATSMIE